jgi:hypothetical protein
MNTKSISVTTLLCAICFALCFWSTVVDNSLPSKLKNELFAVILYKEWYRILTASFVSDGVVIKQLFEIALFYSEAIEYEMEVVNHSRRIFRAFANFIWKSILINFTLVGVESTLYHTEWKLIAWGNCGLVAVTLTYITSRALREPFKQQRAFFLSQPVNNIYYLITILCLTWISNSGLRLANIIAIFISFTEYQLMLLLSNTFDNVETKQVVKPTTYGVMEGDEEDRDLEPDTSNVTL